MTNRETIGLVNAQLRYGDKVVIAGKTGLSPFSINKFFGGKGSEMIDENQEKIMEAALEIIGQRKKRKNRIEKLTNSIID